MGSTTQELATRAGTICRVGVSALIAGFWRSRSIKQIEANLQARSSLQQAAIVAAVLSLLLALSLFAAQFGWIGTLVFWLAIIVIVN
ncbi:MAG: hypothetical protein AAGF50_12195 [Pseudomonadota bacterium]